MSVLLSEEWCERATEALASAAASPVGEPSDDAEVEIVVTGGSAEVPATRWIVRAGRLAAVRPAPGDGEAPAARIPQSADDMAAMLAGDLDPAVAFMRGDVKPEGSAAAVLAFLSAMSQPSCRAALAGVGAA